MEKKMTLANKRFPTAKFEASKAWGREEEEEER
jgi:hypothetical protein